MKTSQIIFASFASLTAALFCGAPNRANGQQNPPATTNEADAALGEAVLQLLAGGDAAQFASSVVGSTNDWREARMTNDVTHKSRPSPSTAESVERSQQQIAASAKLLLDQGTRTGVDPTRVRFQVKSVEAKISVPIGPLPVDRIDLPFANEIKIVLTGDSADHKLTGDYAVALNGGLKFSSGWRIYEGIRWLQFPPGLADDPHARELRALEKISSGTGSLDATDDPALADLGNAVIKFLQQRDAKLLTTDYIPSFESVWNEVQTKAKGRPDAPSREQLREAWNNLRDHVQQAGDEMLTEASALGLDFSGANITLKSAVAENPYQRGTFGGLVGLDTTAIRFTISVQSDRKSKSGTPIAGDYVVTAGRSTREADGWKLNDNLRWQSFPDGLLDESDRQALAFENFVNEHHALPPGTPAPNFDFARIADGARDQFASLRGKVVILDFWTTTCGPCQAPLAELQTLRELHPGWKGKVEIMTVSIDEELRQAKDHLAKNGWTNTFNTWVGPGGWFSAGTKQFRVTALPTEYLIGPDGKILGFGSRDAGEVAKAVDAILAR